MACRVLSEHFDGAEQQQRRAALNVERGASPDSSHSQ